jgi:ribosome-associated toxin RatA of RatAB toxin-antitoxin module
MARPLSPLLLAAVLLLGAGGKALASADVQVVARRAADLVSVHAQATLQAPLAVVWNTLTDYERLPEFIPGIKRSRVLARTGTITTIEQSGEARFLFLTVPVEVTLEATAHGSTIEVRRIAGTLRHLQGRYETSIVLADPPQVLLRWVGTVALEEDLPPLIAETVIRLQIEEQFAAMVKEIERREQARREAQPGHLDQNPGPKPAPASPAGRRGDFAGPPR